MMRQILYPLPFTALGPTTILPLVVGFPACIFMVCGIRAEYFVLRTLSSKRSTLSILELLKPLHSPLSILRLYENSLSTSSK